MLTLWVLVGVWAVVTSAIVAALGVEMPGKAVTVAAAGVVVCGWLALVVAADSLNDQTGCPGPGRTGNIAPAECSVEGGVPK